MFHCSWKESKSDGKKIIYDDDRILGGFALRMLQSHQLSPESYMNNDNNLPKKIIYRKCIYKFLYNSQKSIK